MTEDLAQRAARHRPLPDPVVIWSVCQECGMGWGEHGCDAHQLAAAWQAAEQENAAWEEGTRQAQPAILSHWKSRADQAEQQLAAEQAAREECQQRLQLAEMRVLAFERGNKALDCKTPKCSQERTVLLDGPDPAELQGERAVWVAWWCGSCHTIWSNTLKEWAWEQGAARAAEEDHATQ